MQDIKALPEKVDRTVVEALVMKHASVGRDENALREAKDMSILLEAYLGVAKKRFIDNVAQIVNCELEALPRSALLMLQHVSDDDLDACLAENQATIRKRVMLKKQAETCKLALEDFLRK